MQCILLIDRNWILHLRDMAPSTSTTYYPRYRLILFRVCTGKRPIKIKNAVGFIDAALDVACVMKATNRDDEIKRLIGKWHLMRAALHCLAGQIRHAQQSSAAMRRILGENAGRFFNYTFDERV